MKENTPVKIFIENLNIVRGTKRVYDNFSLRIEGGSVTALMAPSGCGKTTLLDYIGSVLSGADTKSNGTLRFVDFESHQDVAPRISYMFQDGLLLSNATILKNVMLPLENLMNEKEAERRAVSFLDRVGIRENLDRYPFALSGGEKQRVALARAFAYPSSVLLMDEAFQAQDMVTRLGLVKLFISLQSENRRTVLFVTHDTRDAMAVSDRIVVLGGAPAKILLDEKNNKAMPLYMSSPHRTIERRIIESLQ